MDKGFIYVGFDASGLFKIGLTGNLQKRMRQYRSTNPTFQYLFTFAVENPAVAEAELHAKFGDYRLHLEWFSLCGQDLSWIYTKYTGTTRPFEDFEKLWIAIHVDKIALSMARKEVLDEFIKDHPEYAGISWEVWK